MQLLYHPSFSADVLREALWYEDQRESFGDVFIHGVEEMLSVLGDKPMQFPLMRGSRRVRQAALKRFPFAVFFAVKDDAVGVLAVEDLRRSPRRILRRVNQRHRDLL